MSSFPAATIVANVFLNRFHVKPTIFFWSDSRARDSMVGVASSP
jgi:hypothetical protein